MSTDFVLTTIGTLVCSYKNFNFIKKHLYVLNLKEKSDGKNLIRLQKKLTHTETKHI